MNATLARIADRIDRGITDHTDADALRAALAQQPAQPVAWKSTTPAYKAFITQAQYEKFGPTHQRWYEPFKCASCTAAQQASPAQARQPLTAERIAGIFYPMGTASAAKLQVAMACARAIEAAHGIGDAA